MSSRIINVAVIGTGEITMCTHLPILGLLSHLFEVKALVDVSQQALAFCAKKFHIDKTFTDVGEMLAACPEVEMVMICHSDEFHTPHAIQCLEAGKDIFIEKPMAQTLHEADSIEAARIASGKKVFVSFQRRFATAFLRVKDIVKKMEPGTINYVRIRNLTSRVPDGIISQCGAYPARFSDTYIPPEAIENRRSVAKSQYEELTGLDFDSPVSQYIRACKFHISPHDTSVMRELFGQPKHVISAVSKSRGNFLAVMFQYDGFVLALESGQDEVLAVDATVDICTQKQRISLRFDSPYIKGLPITATTLSRLANGDHSEETIRPTYEDYYTLQFKQVYSCMVEGAHIKTDVLDSKEDVVLTAQILQALAKSFNESSQ